MRTDGPRIRGRRGIASLIVLWALLILGTLGMSFSFAMRTEALATRNGLDGERAYFQARTGIYRTLALLAALPPDNVVRERISGGEEDAGYDVRFESESGRIDINLVPEMLLKDVLRRAGLSGEEAEEVGDAILDWRDGDDEPRTHGAEAPDYASAPEPVRPRNGNLESVEELRAVKGVGPDLFRRLLSKAFTVHGGASQVNVNAAPRNVLEALPGFTPELAVRVVARRGETPFRSPTEVAAFLGEEGAPAAYPPFAVAPSTNVYAITSVGRAGGAAVRAIRCLVEVGGAGGKPAKILRWADNVPRDGEEA